MDKAAYRLLSGVRGPDNASPVPSNRSLATLKSLLTSRIRGIVFRSDECAGLLTTMPFTEEDFDYLKSTLRSISTSWRDHRHFTYHLYDAIRSTEHHPVWGEFGPAITRLLDEFSSGVEVI